MSCGVVCRHGSDPTWLWLWHRLVATAVIRPLAWEPPYAAGVAQRNSKKTKKKKFQDVENKALNQARGPVNKGSCATAQVTCP